MHEAFYWTENMLRILLWYGSISVAEHIAEVEQGLDQMWFTDFDDSHVERLSLSSPVV